MEDEALKKISTILVSIMTLFLLAACGKNAKPETTTKEDTVQKTATKLKVDTKKEKINALGNALINIKTNAKAEVKITNLKTRKTEVAKADAEGKVVYNVHLGKKVKSIQFEIGSTASGHTASSTIKVTIINNSDAYTEWAANSASTSTDADAVSMDESSSSEESSVDTQSTDQSADTTGVDTTTDAANNTPAGGAATTGTAGNTGGSNYTPANAGNTTSNANSTANNSTANSTTTDSDAAADNGANDVAVQTVTEKDTEN